MSQMGEVLDALVALAVSAGITTAANAEHGVRRAGELDTGDHPHCFVYHPDESAEPLEFDQEEVRLAVAVVIVTENETQEEMTVHLDSYRDAVKADRTLGGIVRYAWVSRREILEDPDVAQIFGVMEVTTLEAR